MGAQKEIAPSKVEGECPGSGSDETGRGHLPGLGGAGLEGHGGGKGRFPSCERDAKMSKGKRGVAGRLSNSGKRQPLERSIRRPRFYVETCEGRKRATPRLDRTAQERG